MKFLVIYSHPHPQSFNNAIKETVVRALQDSRQEVRVRDLYAIGFDPVLSANDLACFREKQFPPDIQREQEQIRWADILIFICPIWWGGLTANLRGYFDRVFSLNFAYAETESGIKGLLAGKKALFISTLGAPESVYRDMGMIKSMNQTIDQVIGDFCGMEMLDHVYLGSVVACPQEERLAMLEKIKGIVLNLSMHSSGRS